MAINFPNNPAVNDTFTVGGINFTFTGVKWESGAVVEISSDTTPSLGGTLDAGTHNINNVGVITATTFSGNLTGNVTGNLTGNADTATTATTATNAQGLTGDPNIQVTNATVLGNLDVQGTTTTIDTAVTAVDSLAVDGSVGIGTTNPRYPLEVNDGNLLVSGSAAGNLILEDRSVGDSSRPFALLASNDGNFTITNANRNASGTTTSSVERLRIISDGRIGIATDNPNSMGRVSIVVPSTGGHGAINIQNPEVGTGKTNIVFRSLDNNGGNWADAELRAEGYSFKIRTTERFRIDFDGTVSDSMGPLRDIPLNDESTNASYTLVASDAGKVVHVHSTTTTVVVPNSVFSVGNVVTILNGGTSNITITQGSGLSLRNSGDGSTGNRTLAQYGMATIYFTGAGVGYISGSNMT